MNESTAPTTARPVVEPADVPDTSRVTRVFDRRNVAIMLSLFEIYSRKYEVVSEPGAPAEVAAGG